MKKALIIIGALAVLSTGALAGLCFYLFNSKEEEKNKAKTAPARAARWAQPKEDEPESPVLEEKSKFDQLELKELKDEKS